MTAMWEETVTTHDNYWWFNFSHFLFSSSCVALCFTCLAYWLRFTVSASSYRFSWIESAHIGRRSCVSEPFMVWSVSLVGSRETIACQNQYFLVSFNSLESIYSSTLRFHRATQTVIYIFVLYHTCLTGSVCTGRLPFHLSLHWCDDSPSLWPTVLHPSSLANWLARDQVEFI